MEIVEEKILFNKKIKFIVYDFGLEEKER